MKLLLQIIHQLSITIGIQEMDASAEFAGAPELINSWLQVSELQEYNVTRLRLNGPRLCCMKPPACCCILLLSYDQDQGYLLYVYVK